MDENYYRSLIEKVKYNHAKMWRRYETPNYGFDDFTKLWEIMNDDEIAVSPQTYFEAMGLCINSFYGTIQDTTPVWQNILWEYRCAIEKNDDNKENFLNTFSGFLEEQMSKIPEMSVFYGLMRLAIENEDIAIINGIINHEPIQPEAWDLLKEYYENYPEWAAYFECFTDVCYEYLPDSPIFKNTIHTIYSKLGDRPEFEKVRSLHDLYFGNLN